MRKILLFLSLIFCSMCFVAQAACEVNTTFTDVKYEQTADNVIALSWKYSDVQRNDVFRVYRYQKIAGVWSEEILLRTILATDPCEYKDYPEGQVPTVPEKQDPTAETLYTSSIYGLDLTGNKTYVFAIEFKRELPSGEDLIYRVYIQQEGESFKPATSFECATEYTYTYGLNWQEPDALTNKKSQSVTLNWQPYAATGDYLYTVFGVKHDKVFETTKETSATVNHLESGIDPETGEEISHEFQVRAYDENGKYIATTPVISYTPEPVVCLTFPEVSASRNTVTLTILGYGDGFDTQAKSYILTNGDEKVECQSITNNEFTFEFISIDYNQPFRLETMRKVDGMGEVKAVGIFELNSNGTLKTQYCDIIFDLHVTHVTQHTVQLEWADPGFDPTNAILQYQVREDASTLQTIELANPKANVYDLGGLEHSTEYEFTLKLSDEYNNQAKATATATTKVGSICGMENTTSGSIGLGCTAQNGGVFLMPYDLEFYTAYRDAAKKDPYVVIRFKPLGTQQLNEVKLYATTEKNVISDVVGITTQAMSKGEDGWYSAELDKLGWISFLKTDIKEGQNIRFSVSVKHNDGCNGTIYSNTYFTKFVSYKVGTGCQDDEVFSIIKFEKIYERQSQFTLQTNGRMAAVGVFTEDGYLGGEKFDLNKRVFYNNFDDAPSKFTLDISDYEVGVYYMHIHDVYGEAGELKYLWAIY